MFKDVSAKLNINEMELAILKFWKDQDIFAKVTESRKGGPEFVFFEGPPTANGRPGVHHGLSRSFKDLFPRYKVMQGYHVIRRGGWDTHGLPVEIEVEKKLGFTNKQQIEEYGIDNEACYIIYNTESNILVIIEEAKTKKFEFPYLPFGNEIVLE